MKCWIAGIEGISTVDWPGKIVSVIFLSGCNLKCRYCYNSHILEISSGKLLNAEEVEEKVSKNLPLLDGILFSGGEPTLQPGVLHELASWAKRKGLLVGVESNGTRPDVLSALLGDRLLDFVAIDVKAPINFENYSRITPISPSEVQNIKMSLDLLRRTGIEFEVRTTLVPNLIREEDLEKMYGEVKGCKWIWQKFRKLPTVLDQSLLEFSPSEISRIRELSRRFEGVVLRFWE
ncbi:MAG: anaerobic ribonucleoside-triphosphate reductase activating protein [Candidatus Nanoarchaeia archaeon]|nr:anaerobic ribonucleoside-triphosphate reductase activating protein [Candidatus Haiyanarchaeum thermophilum]MCW1303303.1 anaerobic ribonucleoside-triphosphate reductase activating protein [Candidatus Haiyanarchaeum thermophilum]MCW1303965.1 anaerobic ribonucleoside-triphosphate reductase activating protein [Candidatus Haiyanarchaeum thermophilum]MCW1306462.1 anaerobic ribonucleoside-triphosphate reductase activating protein [Candidatus Haiyanarchaeum thermophilum]MCW1307240.1 anaerobic ribonu